MIVRRFLVAPAIARLVRRGLPSAPVTEGHFAPSADRSIRVRLEHDESLLVLRTGEEGVFNESAVTNTRDQADALIEVSAGTIVYEVARLALDSGHTALLHSFTDPGPLTLVEVQFDAKSELDSFQTPLWFATDVSDCDNQTIALQQLSVLADIPITSEAVEAALDAIEHQELRSALGRDSAAPASSLSELERLHGQMVDEIADGEPARVALAG